MFPDNKDQLRLLSFISSFSRPYLVNKPHSGAWWVDPAAYTDPAAYLIAPEAPFTGSGESPERASEKDLFDPGKVSNGYGLGESSTSWLAQL